MKDTGHVTGKLDIDFFDFLGDFHRFSISIRIKVHFYSFALGNERTLVACKSLRSASLQSLNGALQNYSILRPGYRSVRFLDTKYTVGIHRMVCHSIYAENLVNPEFNASRKRTIMTINKGLNSTCFFLHEKQRSRIQSLYLYFIKIVPLRRFGYEISVF